MTTRLEDSRLETTGEVRTTPFGVVERVRIQRYDELPMSWPEVWRKFNSLYPGRWAFQVFPPARALVDLANIYHLWVLPEGTDVGGANLHNADWHSPPNYLAEESANGNS